MLEISVEQVRYQGETESITGETRPKGEFAR